MIIIIISSSSSSITIIITDAIVCYYYLLLRLPITISSHATAASDFIRSFWGWIFELCSWEALSTGTERNLAEVWGQGVYIINRDN